jgi:hypothetical protein
VGLKTMSIAASGRLGTKVLLTHGNVIL